MDVELASLAVAIDAKSADPAAASLDKFAAAGGRAEGAAGRVKGAAEQMGASFRSGVDPVTQLEARIDKLLGSVDPLYTAQKRVNAEIQEATALYKLGALGASDYARAMGVLEEREGLILRSQGALNGSLRDGVGHAKAMQQAGLNMGRQLSDVFVQLGSGTPLFLVALQQGPQIFDGLQVAAMQTGTTVRGAMAAMGASIWAATAPLLPFIAAATAAAAIMGGAFALATRAVSKDIGNLTEGMGLSADQMKKLKDEGVSTSVTMGDVFRGAGTTIKEGFFEVFGSEIEDLDKKWQSFLDDAWKFVVTASKNITGSLVGAAYVIKDTWRLVPAALGDAAYSAANLVLKGVEWMINKGVSLLNILIDKANAAADAIPGLEAFIPRLDAVALSISNPFQGAMANFGRQAAASFGEGFQAGAGLVERTASRLVENIAASGRARIRAAAGDASRAVGSIGQSAADAADKVEVMTQRLSRLDVPDIKPLDMKVPELVEPLLVVAQKLQLIDGLARQAGQGMAEAFGQSGAALGDLLTAFTGYQAQLGQINLAEKEHRLTSAQAARERSAAEIKSYGDMTSAARGFFEEGSTGYRALTVATMAFRAVEFALSVKAMVMNAAEGGSKIAQSVKNAAAYGAEAVANALRSIPFPFNLVAAGVTAAAVAALGISVIRSFGGGATGGATTPTTPTTNTGTGTVLGSSDEVSKSIQKSIEYAEKYYRQDLLQGSEMVDSLRKIEDGIGAVTTSIARQLGVSGGFSTDGLNLGSEVVKSFFGLFSTQRTRQLVDQGLELFANNLGDILTTGLSGRIYQTVENSKTKSGFFGLGGGTTTWQETTFSGLPADLSRELTNLLGTLRDGVLTAAGQLGVEGAAAVLDAFQINIGRISFEGLTSEEISQKLSDVFSAVGDQMATAIVPQLAIYQKAGEGMMETLTRLAVTFNAVDTTLTSIGMTFNATGLASLEARNRLVELLGGLEGFTDSAAFFADNFLTEAQLIAPIQAAVNAELTRLGIATDISRSQFADLVMGLDVSTAEGAGLYAALMKLAPALAQVLDYTEETSGAITNAVDLARQRRDLEIQLMEATGNAAGALAARRADELAAMDESLRGLQEQIWAAQDAAEAQRALAEIARQRSDLEIQLLEAQGRSSEALAARRAMELAALDATLRPLQEAIYAAQDLAAAQAAAAEAAAQAAEAERQLAEQRSGLEIRLLRAQGKELAAVARERELELAALPEVLRALQQQVWAAEDAAAANAALAQAQEEAAQRAQAIAEQRSSMEIELLRAQGKETAAVAAERRLELAALDPTLRALQAQIYAAQDAAAANAALAQAQAEAAQKAAEIAKQRDSLQVALLNAQGKASAATALQRKIELAAMDAGLRALQLSVWAAEDAKAAQEALAEAQSQAAQAAKDAAERMLDLRERLLSAQGKDAAVTALQRERELAAAANNSERAILRQIYAAEDAAKAAEAAADRQSAAMDRVETARSALTDAYERESSALQDTIDKFDGFSTSLKEFRKGLIGQTNPAGGYAATQAEFRRIAALAKLGNQDALGGLQHASEAYLEAAKANAGSSVEYQRVVASVIGAVDAAIGTADRQKTLAEQQLDQLDASVSKLITINESVLSVADAIKDLKAAMRGAGVVTTVTGAVVSVPAATVPSVTSVTPVNDNATASEIAALRREMAAERADRKAEMQALILAQAEQNKRQKRWDADGLFVRGAAPGDPVSVEAA